jgi:hypothetical protein
VRVVVNHLPFRDPIDQSVLEAADDVGRKALEAGATAFHLVQLDERRAMLVILFPDRATEERITHEIGGPWMRENIVPLLAGPPQRSSGEVVAGSG